MGSEALKITGNAQLVLAAAELQPDIPITKLRAQTGLKDHVVRYTLRKLIEQRLVREVPFIDIHKLGFTIVDLFFGVATISRARTDALLRQLITSPEVVWIGEFVGEYQIGIGLCVSQPSRVHEFIMQLHQSFEDVLFQKTLSFQHSMTVYPRRYLLPDAKDSSPLSSTSTQSREVIDTIDHQLLQAVAALPGSSQRELAEHLGVSPTMIDVRLRRLRERGILIGMVLALAPHELGVTEYKLILRGRGTHPQLAPAIHRIAQTNPHVTYVIECLGGWDFEIGVESDDPRDVSTLTQLLLFEFGRFIEAITMLTKVHDHKQRWYPGPATVGKLRARAP